MAVTIAGRDSIVAHSGRNASAGPPTPVPGVSGAGIGG